MPWNGSKYTIPVLAQGVDTYAQSLPYARKKRAEWASYTQEMKQHQKQFSQMKDYNSAKQFKEFSKWGLMLEQCFDYVVKYCEGNPLYTNWRHKLASQEMAQELDNCFEHTFNLIEPESDKG